MVRRPEPNLLHCDVSLCVPVCLHLEIQRLRECQVILNRIVSPIFGVVLMKILETFRSEDEGDYEYEFSVLNMRIRFGGQHFSKCACSEQKTRTRSRPRPPIIWRTMRMMLKKALTHKLTSRVLSSRDVLTAPFKCHF